MRPSAAVTSTPAPFEQLPFDALPERPRRPHDYDATPARELKLDSDSFGDIRIHYREVGEGEPLLLVHGLMTSSYSFRYVMTDLARDHRVICPDLPGSGRSALPDRSYHPDRYADFLAEFLDAVDARGAKVIGNSMGGYLAMRLALRDPGAMTRLVNLHSPGVPLARLYVLRRALALPMAERVLATMIRRDPERWVHRNVHYYDETLKSLEEAREYARPLRTEEGRRAFFRILRETMDVGEIERFATELRARAAKGEPFPVPLQLVYAARDPMVPSFVGNALRASLPDAEFVMLEEASHFAHVDATQAFLDVARPFLEGSRSK